MNTKILNRAMERLLGRSAEGDLAFTRAFAHDDIQQIIDSGVRNIPGWQVIAVGAANGEGWITADQAVELRESKGPATFLLIRGKAANPGSEVMPGMPAVLVDAQPVFPAPKRTSLRRLTLAQWIANPENPLTARVFANRVWQHLLGRGIVPTPNNFGRAGVAPTHPELLDWLAAELIGNGWKLKRLIKTIMMSRVYQMSSRADRAEPVELDPANDLYWRQRLHRLEAEALRDSMLAVGDTLKRDRPGRVRVEAAAIGRHDFETLQLVHNGKVVHAEKAVLKEGACRAHLMREVPIDQPGWFAARIESTSSTGV